MSEKIKISIVDKSSSFSEATRSLFKRLPQYQIISQSTTERQFFRSLKKNLPDAVCLLGIKDTGEIISFLQKKFPDIIIFLPDTSDERILLYQQMRPLLHSCVKKNFDLIDSYISNTLLAVGNYMNEEILSSALQKKYQNVIVSRQPLSLREQQVAALTTLSYTAKETGVILDISENSVKTLRKRVLRKIGGHSKSDIISYGLKHKLHLKFGYSRKKLLKKVA